MLREGGNRKWNTFLLPKADNYTIVVVAVVIDIDARNCPFPIIPGSIFGIHAFGWLGHTLLQRQVWLYHASEEDRIDANILLPEGLPVRLLQFTSIKRQRPGGHGHARRVADERERFPASIDKWTK